MRVQRSNDGTILNAAVLTAGDVAGQRVLCPACMEVVLERWPEDWVSHAEERCRGVADVPRDDRAAQFRRALGHLIEAAAPVEVHTFAAPLGGPVPTRELGTPRLEPRPHLPVESFVEFVRTLEGRVLRGGETDQPFTVGIGEGALIYTPEESGKGRLHRFSRVQDYLDEFAESGSLDPAYYHEGGNRDYVLALIRIYREERPER